MPPPLHLLLLLLALLQIALFTNALPTFNLPADDEENESRRSFYYDLSAIRTEPELLTCANYAVASVNNGTCIGLEAATSSKSNGQDNANIRFVPSRADSACGFDPRNSTIYLNRRCAANGNNCLQLLGRALTGEKSAAAIVAAQINAHFSCEDRCSLQCQNGGVLDTSAQGCSCRCPFNGLFTGETCAELVRLGEYTDSACGLINATGESGILKLSGSLDGNTYCQFLVNSPDPWSRVEIEFLSLDMSNKLAGSIDCPDKLQVYGLESAPVLSVKCAPVDAPKPGQKFVSASNFLLLQLEGNRFDGNARGGPIIRYNIQRAPISDDIHPATNPAPQRESDDAHTWDQQGNGRGIANFFGSGNLTLVALFVVLGGVLAIIFVLVAIRRHSSNQLKRNNHTHSPVPTSPIPPNASA